MAFPKLFFVTGVSSGFGDAFAAEALGDGRSMVGVTSKLPDDGEMFAPLRKAGLASNGRRSGDRVRAACAIRQLIEMDRPPRHLLLGSVALQLVAESGAKVDAELHVVAALSPSTDFAAMGPNVGTSSQHSVAGRRR